MDNLTDMLITGTILAVPFAVAILALWLRERLRKAQREHVRAMRKAATWPIAQHRPLDVEFLENRPLHRLMMDGEL